MQKAFDVPVTIPGDGDGTPGRGGIEAAEEVIAFQVAQITALKNVIEEEGISCDFLVTRSFDVFLDETLSRERVEMVRGKVEAGLETARKEVQILDGQGAGVNGREGVERVRG